MQELKGQAKQGAERREAIVDAALEVFAQRGYPQRRARPRSRRRSISPRPGILYHFGSKEALLLAVIAEREQKSRRDLRRVPRARRLGVVARRSALRRTERTRAWADRVARGPARRKHRRRVPNPRLLPRTQPLHARVGGEDVARRASGRRGASRRRLHGEGNGVHAFLEGAAAMWLLDRSVSLVALYEGYIDAFIEAVANLGSN